jgi:hypothetical protein
MCTHFIHLFVKNESLQMLTHCFIGDLQFKDVQSVNHQLQCIVDDNV